MLNFIKIIMDFIISIVFDLMIFVVMFEFLLEVMGTSVHHPLRQAILRYTQPLLLPLHRFFPVYRNVDTGLIFLLYLLEVIKILLLSLLAWQFPHFLLVLVWSTFLLINTLLNFYFFALLFRLLISWVIPIYANHPITQILFILTEPILRPIRKRFAPITGFDWTPLAVIVLIQLLSMVVNYTLALMGAPRIIL